jgi:hypothetical protein
MHLFAFMLRVASAFAFPAKPCDAKESLVRRSFAPHQERVVRK